ncbi:MAG: hypothetical protein F4W68_06800 [Cenarchaeum sp. SB0661_bin_35]|nr:hypothetical protein [Cenarchaeum sp. SB0662_bin_33]MYC80186.1 hypothetical protein [Cenarchaeum sp. SB0661_bin_35]MYI51212.1 hypothetical protein [Cenarchaeum sp. SB0673_bin_9]
MKNTTKIATAVTLAAISIVGIIQVTSMDTPTIIPSDARAFIGGEGTLEEQRIAALESNQIPDYYLITKTGDVWLEHHTQDEIDKHEQVLVNMLNHGEDTDMRQLTTSLSLTGNNFVTLSEKPNVELDEVTALALQYNILSGSYTTPPEEPVRKYYEHLLKHYDLPATIAGVEQRLVEIAGEMAPLHHIILKTHTQWAELGAVYPPLFDEDPHYWWAVTFLFECEYNQEDDCSSERDYLENKRWTEDEPEFIPPPGQEWPPIFNFIIPAAHALSYAPMDYTLYYRSVGCGGICSQGNPVSGATSVYLSNSWAPPDSSGCGHLTGSSVYTTFKVERRDSSAYSTSSLSVTAHTKMKSDLDHGYVDTAKAVTNIKVSDNSRAYWCYEAGYIGYSLTN